MKNTVKVSALLFLPVHSSLRCKREKEETTIATTQAQRQLPDDATQQLFIV